MRPIGHGALALLLATIAACDGSGSSEPSDQRSTTLDLVDATPILGVLIADCTESGATTLAGTEETAPDSPIRLIELPPADSLFGGELSEFLVHLDLHGAELPVVAGLTSSIEDPTLALPLPLDQVLALLPATGIPNDTPVLGATDLGCGADSEAEPFGLVPLFGGMQSAS